MPPAPDAPVAHRRDIEGLRAVAVLLVVLSHAGVAGFAGGYVGVDVFFVISGFLITTLLVRELARTGRISLTRFYARRAVRLLPASTLVVAVTLAGSWLWLSPVRIAEYAGDALASAGYAGNIRLAVAGTDYFADAAPSPFQHFWSLAVEEQFYLLWPLLVLGVFAIRRRRRLLALVLTLLTVASLAYSAYQLTWAAPWAYFGLPSRAWELGMGALVALAAARLSRLPRWAVPVLGWGGLAAIAGSALGYGDATAFPGLAALPPVLGAAGIIGAGCASTGGVGKFLARAPMQSVGRVSYGWYLWHWPVLVIVPAALGGGVGTGGRLLLCLAALLLAYASRRFVEDPVRHSRALTDRPARGLGLGLALSGAAAALALLVAANPPAVPVGADATDTRTVLAAAADPQEALGNLIAAADRRVDLPANLTPSLDDASADAVKPQTDGCHLTLTSPKVNPRCTYGRPGASRSVVLFGDSHALQWFPAFEKLANRHGWALVSLTRSSCSPAPVPVVNSKLKRDYTECDSWRAAALARIRALRPQLVVVASSTGYRDSLAGHPADPDALWANAWARLFATVRVDAADVVLLVDTPYLSQDPAECLARQRATVSGCAEPVSTVLRDPDWRAIVDAAAARAGAMVVDPVPWLCGVRCPTVVGNLLVYRDTNHLTSVYAEMLAPLLDARLRMLRGDAGAAAGRPAADVRHRRLPGDDSATPAVGERQGSRSGPAGVDPRSASTQ
jgi:peptidoglycan/LPS O-acetylase OafA/YrhL